MAINIDDLIRRLPKKTQEAINSRAKELIEEEMNLQGLRKAQQLTQNELAQKLGVKQAEISRLEQRTDMYLSTLQSCVKAMGGTLEIIARFPKKSVRVSGLGRNTSADAIVYRNTGTGHFVSKKNSKSGSTRKTRHAS